MLLVVLRLLPLDTGQDNFSSVVFSVLASRLRNSRCSVVVRMEIYVCYKRSRCAQGDALKGAYYLVNKILRTQRIMKACGCLNI